MERRTSCPLLPSSDPRIFGPVVWQALHVLAESYPVSADDEKQHQCKRFLFALSHMLPCAHCAKHFRTCLRKPDLRRAVRGKDALVAFLVHAHNAVSRHTRPNQAPYGVNCAKRQYSYMRANSPLARVWLQAKHHRTLCAADGGGGEEHPRRSLSRTMSIETRNNGDIGAVSPFARLSFTNLGTQKSTKT